MLQPPQKLRRYSCLRNPTYRKSLSTNALTFSVNFL
eukprot:UN13464